MLLAENPGTTLDDLIRIYFDKQYRTTLLWSDASRRASTLFRPAVRLIALSRTNSVSCLLKEAQAGLQTRLRRSHE
jgi:hypothetical protein